MKSTSLIARICGSRHLPPLTILLFALIITFGILVTPLGKILAGGTMQFAGSSVYDNGIFSCGVVYSGGNISFVDTNTCTFSCDAAHSGQSCSVTSEIGTVASPIGCDNSTGCAGGSMYTHICQTTSYTCVYSPPSCIADSSCAANTYTGSTCTDSCGNVYNGTKYPTGNSCPGGGADVGGLGNPACPIVLSCGMSGQVGNWPLCSNPPCTSAANSCGMTSSGTVSFGVCSAVTPSDSLCAPAYSQAAYVPAYSQSYYQASYAPVYSQSYYESSYYAEGSYAPSCTSPTVSITANPSRVKSGQTSTLTVTASGITGTCTVTGPGVSRTFSASSCNVSGTITTPAITQRSTYSVTCDGGTATAKIIINMPFGVFEF